MTDRIYLNRAESLWVEATDEAVVVSWPHGHKALPYEVTVPELLALVGRAVQDTYEPIFPARYTRRQMPPLPEPESSEPSS